MAKTGGRVAMSAEEKSERAARIAALRSALGLTQQTLADKAGLPRETVTKIELAQNAATSAQIQAGLSRGIGVSVLDLQDYLEGRLDVRELLARRAPPNAPIRPFDAIIAMARAQGYPDQFVAAWRPDVAGDADTLWTLCKADFARWQKKSA